MFNTLCNLYIGQSGDARLAARRKETRRFSWAWLYTSEDKRSLRNKSSINDSTQEHY